MAVSVQQISHHRYDVTLDLTDEQFAYLKECHAVSADAGQPMSLNDVIYSLLDRLISDDAFVYEKH